MIREEDLRKDEMSIPDSPQRYSTQFQNFIYEKVGGVSFTIKMHGSEGSGGTPTLSCAAGRYSGIEINVYNLARDFRRWEPVQEGRAQMLRHILSWKWGEGGEFTSLKIFSSVDLLSPASLKGLRLSLIM